MSAERNEGRGSVKVDLEYTGLLSQGAALVFPLEKVGSSAGSLGEFPVKTKMCCATPCCERRLVQGGSDQRRLRVWVPTLGALQHSRTEARD